LLLAAPPFVVALSWALEVDLALALCESSDLDLDLLAAALEEVNDARAAAVLHPVRQTPANRSSDRQIARAPRQMRKPPAQPCRQRAVRA
jgi:hypothetical protein